MRIPHPRHAGSAPLLLSLLIGGCDRSTGEIIQEIDAARAECTEDRLRAGAEECVQMFEKYADMGADAIETYIGALRALDQALQRRGPFSFDTTGLGRALTEPPADSLAGADWSLQSRGSWNAPLSPSGARSPGRGDYGDPWPDGAAGSRATPGPDRSRPQPSWEADERWTDGTSDHDSPRGPTSDGQRRTPPRRGALLPPEERLRRPWLDEPGGLDDTYDRAPRPPEEPPPAPWQERDPSRDLYDSRRQPGSNQPGGDPRLPPDPWDPTWR